MMDRPLLTGIGRSGDSGYAELMNRYGSGWDLGLMTSLVHSSTVSGMHRLMTSRVGSGPLAVPFADLALAVTLFVVAEVEVVTGRAPWSSAVASHAVAVPTTALMTLPLAWRRRYPLAALGTILSAALLEGVLSAPPESVAVMVAWIVALYSVARYEPTGRASLGLAAAAVAGAALAALGPSGSLSDYLAAVFVPTVPPFLAGMLWARHVRGRELEALAHRLEAERDERTREAVVQERARIARELHDVVAHSVSTMVVQAQAGDSLLASQPERTREALLAIEDSGRQALVELRRLLGLLREEPGAGSRSPQPGLADLEVLLSSVRQAGLPVALEVEGEPIELSPGLDLTAYRIIQEALTNSLKHGGADSSIVSITYGPRALAVEIVDNGAAMMGMNGGGHGLIGMRERVSLYNGELDVGPARTGGFAVRARIPLEPVR